MKLYKLAVCAGPNCSARFSADVKAQFEKLVEKMGLGANIIVGDGGCYGQCTKGPNVLIIGPIPREEEKNYRKFKVIPRPEIPKTMRNGVMPGDCEGIMQELVDANAD
jgi:hypothetical protein